MYLLQRLSPSRRTILARTRVESSLWIVFSLQPRITDPISLIVEGPCFLIYSIILALLSFWTGAMFLDPPGSGIGLDALGNGRDSSTVPRNSRSAATQPKWEWK